MANYGYLVRFIKLATSHDLENSEANSCCICYDDFPASAGTDLVDQMSKTSICTRPSKLSCGHMFGEQCILKALQNGGACARCPLCRRPPKVVGTPTDDVLAISVKRLEDVVVPLLLDELDEKWGVYEEKYSTLISELVGIPLLWVKATPTAGYGEKGVRSTALREVYWKVFSKNVPRSDTEAWTNFEVVVETIIGRLTDA